MTTPPTRKNPTPRIFLASDPEAVEMEFAERMIASAAGLPRLCHMKKCRRRGRCFGPYDGSLPCKRLHPHLYRQRFGAALRRLGWPME